MCFSVWCSRCDGLANCPGCFFGVSGCFYLVMSGLWDWLVLLSQSTMTWLHLVQDTAASTPIKASVHCHMQSHPQLITKNTEGTGSGSDFITEVLTPQILAILW